MPCCILPNLMKMRQQEVTSGKEERDLRQAAAHIDDAVKGRGAYGKARAMFQTPALQRCFAVLDSRWWQRLLLCVVLLHCVLVVWQPSQVGVSPGTAEWGVLVGESVCLLIYVADVLLIVAFLGWRDFWRAEHNTWARVEFIFTGMFIIDLTLLISQRLLAKRLLAPFRCVRAMVLPCKAKNVAHVIQVCLAIGYKLGKLFVVIILFILLFAGVGIHVFPETYHVQNNVTSADLGVYAGAFDHVGIAALRLFVLFTTENYPAVMLPAFNSNPWTWVYFGSFVYIGVFFLTAILLASVVENYWQVAKEHVKTERRRERAELAKAWNILDPNGSGVLPTYSAPLLKLIATLRPKNTRQEHRDLLEYIDEDGDGEIDTYEWTTRAGDALRYDFETEAGPANDDLDFLEDGGACVRSVCRGVSTSRVWMTIWLLFMLLHSVLFCVHWRGMSDDSRLAVHVAQSILVCTFLVEGVIKVIGLGKLNLQPMELLDHCLIIIAVVTNITWYVVTNETARSLSAVASSVLVVGRLGLNSSLARHAIATLVKILPVLADLVLLLLIIIYFYAVVGLELFSGVAAPPGQDSAHFRYGCGLGFDTFPCAMLGVFQVATTSNWHEVMNGAIAGTSAGAALYFVSCYLVIDLVVTNLFAAITIEAFKKLTARGEDKPGKKPADLRDRMKSFIRSTFSSSRPSVSGPSRRPSLAEMNEQRRASIRALPPALRRLSRVEDSDEDEVLDEGLQQLRRRSSATFPGALPGQPLAQDPATTERLYTRQGVLRARLAARRKYRHSVTSQPQVTFKVAMAHRPRSGSDEISLHVGEEVMVLERLGDRIYGTSAGKTGWFPAARVIEVVSGVRRLHRRVHPAASPDAGAATAAPHPQEEPPQAARARDEGEAGRKADVTDEADGATPAVPRPPPSILKASGASPPHDRRCGRRAGLTGDARFLVT